MPGKSQVAEKRPNLVARKLLTDLANTADTLDVAQRTIKREAVIALMKKKQGERSMRQFAQDLGVTPAYVCDIYKGRRNPGPKVLSKLGVTRKDVPVQPTYELAV